MDFNLKWLYILLLHILRTLKPNYKFLLMKSIAKTKRKNLNNML